MTSAKITSSEKSKNSGGDNKFQTLAWILVQSLCHGIIFAIVFSIIWYSFVDYELFSFHPTCFSIGYFLFITEGFLIFLPNSVVTRNLKRQTIVKIHIALQTLGFAFIVSGFVIIIVHKFNKGYSHFVTPHSITGLVAVILTALSTLGGITTRLKVPNLARIKLGHNFIGLLAYGVAIAAMCMGVWAELREVIKEEWCIVIIVLTCVVAAVALANALFSFIRRVKNL
ncbi:transmembrane reductase CYB561D2-like [Neocloeon triangulifer]|uniref:transmembrane reductase CYB561D2-like n=1 Tax=Neocloeon triangulifer TaxID=2078957 RepID=UPI00286F92E5|nr:transmembrane reductase CYB561D2-like [Neocloeon triangulifer]